MRSDGRPDAKAPRADPLLGRNILHGLVGDGSAGEATTQALDQALEPASCMLETFLRGVLCLLRLSGAAGANVHIADGERGCSADCSRFVRLCIGTRRS